MEKIKIQVQKVFPEDACLMAKWNQQELLVKGTTIDVYAGDELTAFGVFRQTKRLGRYFDMQCYRECITPFWIAKWLKHTTSLSDRKIAKMVASKKAKSTLAEPWKQVIRWQKMLSHLLHTGVPEEILSKIEQDYRFRHDALFKDPYALLQYSGLTFSHVHDMITRFHCANPLSSKSRYALHHELVKATRQGHLGLPFREAQKILAGYEVSLEDALCFDHFSLFQEKVFLAEHLTLEQDIAKTLRLRLALPKETCDDALIRAWESHHRFTLAKNQTKAVQMAMQEPISIITGGPGVGKTTVCKCITDLLGESKTVVIAAPTGRAAKRAQESTGLLALTAHRLLGYTGQGFTKNETNPIEADVLVIDESSMIDSFLLHALLKAVPLTTKIIFVGDVDQLPSVGPGQILKDLIDSKHIPVTRLTDIFRQAAGSPIIQLAYAVNRGEMPVFSSHHDLVHESFAKEQELAATTLRIAEQLYREHGLFDVQVLIPLYSGPAGIDFCNRELQKRLNPGSPSVQVDTYELRLGDKVIQTRNDYAKGIYNGDTGVITQCTAKEIKVTFQGSDKEVGFSAESFSDLQLCYATSVHRSQGSEYPHVVIPLAESYGVMLQKNLLYTAITRAKSKLWFLYQPEALARCVRLDSVPLRHTALASCLQSA